MLTQKKPKKNQSLHQNRQIGIGFFGFFLVFFGFLKFPNWHWFFLVFFWFFLVFFWHWFWPEFEIGNCFFWFFLVFFGFFWLKLWPTFEIGNWFLGFFGFFWFFWDFLVFFLAFDFRVRMPSLKKTKKPKKTKKTQKKTKKTQKKTKKKPVATPKLVNWLVFFWFFFVFFGFFWGEHPPYLVKYRIRYIVISSNIDSYLKRNLPEQFSENNAVLSVRLLETPLPSTGKSTYKVQSFCVVDEPSTSTVKAFQTTPPSINL